MKGVTERIESARMARAEHTEDLLAGKRGCATDDQAALKFKTYAPSLRWLTSNSKQREEKGKNPTYPYIGANNIMGYVDEKGMWVGHQGDSSTISGGAGPHKIDKGLMDGFPSIFEEGSSIVDFGCGNADYIKHLISKGFNQDSKALGAFYILAALTLVSHNAAVALPWLYQSVAQNQ